MIEVALFILALWGFILIAGFIRGLVSWPREQRKKRILRDLSRFHTDN